MRKTERRLLLNQVASPLEFGGGNIVVKQFTAQSGASEAGARGSIPLADELTQSGLGLPLDFFVAPFARAEG